MKKNIITIAGRPGSGKSSTAKLVADELGFSHFSSGDLFRSIAQQMNTDVLAANQAAEQQGVSEIDRKVDSRLQQIGREETEIVIDSRTAWHWIPDSFKVFLDLDLSTAATRILSNMTPERIEAEHIPTNPDEYAAQLEARLASENARYSQLYGIDPYQLYNYDLVLDTKVNDLETVASKIIGSYKAWLEN